MQKITIYLMIFIILSSIISCNKQAQNVKHILNKAETIMEQNPDSALVLLEGIHDVQVLKKSLKYKYYLLHIEAKDKCYKDITSDTMIFKVRDYYAKGIDEGKSAKASFYCGRILQEQKKYEEALQVLLDTENSLKRNNNYNIQALIEGSIGRIYYLQNLRDQAIVHYKKAKQLFMLDENFNNKITMNNSIGNCFMVKGETDSAMVYYWEALNIANKFGCKKKKVQILQNIGVAFNSIGKIDSVGKYLNEACLLEADSLSKTKILCNIASIFEQMGLTDSASCYIEKSLSYFGDKKNNHLAAKIYKTWSNIEEKNHNLQSALDKHKSYSRYIATILVENRNRTVMELEKKYIFQKIENEKKELTIVRQQLTIIIMLLLLLLLAWIVFWYKKSLKKELKLKEVEQRFYKMKELAQEYKQKNKSSRRIILHHFDILKKTAFLEKLLSNQEKKKSKFLLKKFNEIVYVKEAFNWNLLYNTLNHLNNGAFDWIKHKYPKLDTSEFRICCLLLAGFDNQEIAILLNYSFSTIPSKRSTIRKKLGIESYGNIKDFLISKYENTNHD